MPGLFRINEDGEREKYCPRCQDWWPADKEFFYTSGKMSRQLHSWCKACYQEWRKVRRAAKKLAATIK